MYRFSRKDQKTGKSKNEKWWRVGHPLRHHSSTKFLSSRRQGLQPARAESVTHFRHARKCAILDFGFFGFRMHGFFCHFPDPFFIARGGGEEHFPLPKSRQAREGIFGFCHTEIFPMLSRRVKFFPFELPPLRKVFVFVLRGDLKKNRTFTEKFFGVRAYTLLRNIALSLSRPNPKNDGKPFAHQGQNGVYFLAITPPVFCLRPPPYPKAEEPRKSKNAFRRPHSGQIDSAPYCTIPPPHEMRTDPLHARLNGILGAMVRVVFQKTMFGGGFWRRKIQPEGQAMKPDHGTATASEKTKRGCFPCGNGLRFALWLFGQPSFTQVAEWGVDAFPPHGHLKAKKPFTQTMIFHECHDRKP